MTARMLRDIRSARSVGYAILLSLISIMLSSATTSRATSVMQFSDEGLVRYSPRIVEGLVISVSSAWDADHKQIWTTVNIRVSNMIRGNAPAGGIVTLRLLGGQVGDEVAEVIDQPLFTTGENVIVFLKDTVAPKFPTTGMSQGKMTVIPDPTTGQLLVKERGVARDTFVRDISRRVRELEGGR